MKVIDETLLEVVVPRSIRGETSVFLQRGANDPVAIADSYWYEGGIALALNRVTPEEIPTEGGWVTLTGDGFTHDTEVLVGSARATSLEFLDETVVRVRLPAATEGWQGLTLNDEAVEPLLVDEAIRYHDPRLAFDDAIPAVGSATGGEVIRILGDDFTPYTTVTFGDRPADWVTWVSRTELEVVTPSSFDGTVDLILEDETRDTEISIYAGPFSEEPNIPLA